MPSSPITDVRHTIISTMKASTIIRFQSKYKLAAIKIDKDDNIKTDFGPVFFALLLVFSGLAGYFLYLRFTSIDSLSFNTVCIEFLAIGLVLGTGFKVLINLPAKNQQTTSSS